MPLTLRSFKNNFTSGELTPTLQGRSDLTPYANGALVMENVIPRPQGGFKRRPGIVFESYARHDDKEAILYPFKFSVTQSYMLEFGENYMRAHTLRARIEETAVNVIGTASGIAARVVIETDAPHGLTTNDPVSVRGILGTSEANADWLVDVVDATHIGLIGSTYSNAWTSGGTVREIYQITTPWAEADLADLRFAQTQNTMIIVHPNYWPYVLQRLTATTFSLTKLDNILDSNEDYWRDGPYTALNRTTTTMTPSATTGTITVTASTGYFAAAMEGMYMRIGGEVSNEQGFVRLTTQNTGDTVWNAEVISTLSGTGATDSWALGAFGDHVGFPTDVSYYQQRLLLLMDNWIHGSATGNIFDFHVGTDADEPFSFQIEAEELNVGRWIVGQDVVLIGTEGAEYAMKGWSGTAITPTNVLIDQQSTFGCANQRPLKIGNSILYIQRAGQRVYDMAFDLDQDKYLSDDITVLANHIFDNDPIKSTAFQLNPNPTGWFVSEGGVLASLTIIASQEVLSWVRHPIPNTVVESVGVVPQSSTSNDDVWILGKVTLGNGQVKRYIGYMDDDTYMDWALYGSLGSTTTATGLEHLEGETVVVTSNGAVYPQRTVTNGTITATDTEVPFTTTYVGMETIPRVIPVSPEFQLPNGPSFGAFKRFNEVKVFCVNTMTMALNGETAAPRTTIDLMDNPPSIPATQIFQYTSLGSAEIVQLILTQPLPLAWDVTSIYGKVEIE
jgi:hypothetical protein